mmetsp:Transcript_77657/g.113702  ORF Transcript_77657/g.113702 Transcript_77657/m.113702 type:complete len:204 (+) Transcript_77657:964-1575(+)
MVSSSAVVLLPAGADGPVMSESGARGPRIAPSLKPPNIYMPHSGELHTVQSCKRPLDFRYKPCMYVCMSRTVLYAPSRITRSTCTISTSSTTIFSVLSVSLSPLSFCPACPAPTLPPATRVSSASESSPPSPSSATIGSARGLSSALVLSSCCDKAVLESGASFGCPGCMSWSTAPSVLATLSTGASVLMPCAAGVNVPCVTW